MSDWIESISSFFQIWSPDLKFVREITVHRDYILALAATSTNVLYASSRDGSTRCFSSPLENDHNEVILQTIADDITQLVVVNDVLFSGDDKGIVTKWYHNKVESQYNLLEEIKSMYVENDYLYIARDSDAVVTDIKPGLMNYTTKATIPGRAPLTLIGPIVDGHKKFLVSRRYACYKQNEPNLINHHDHRRHLQHEMVRV